MSRPREIVAGARQTFAVRFAFLPDPDSGEAASVEESISWGGFEIWVDGKNLCRHLELGESHPAVHWYLFPLIEWFASNWDFLFHEEQLPGRNSEGNAWLSLRETSSAPPTLTDAQTEQWEESWQRWWGCHSIIAARRGGLFPSVVFRRWQDMIEISWGPENLPGRPDHFRFELNEGFARLDLCEVANVLYEAIDDASRHLLGQQRDSIRLQHLRSDVERIKSTDRRRRLGLLASVGDESVTAEERWSNVETMFPADLSECVSAAVFDAAANDLVVAGSSQAALMFGSVSPKICESDARELADALVRLYSTKGENDNLRRLRRDEPLTSSSQVAWQQGYRLAEEFLETLEAVAPSTTGREWIDVEEICEHLEIGVEQITLDDAGIRAVAVAGPKHKPTVMLNAGDEEMDESRRRFTLAHELCHILHDRSYGARLAMVSGPWAPRDLEKRANAFAAMLLMPDNLVDQAVGDLGRPIDTEESVRTVADRLRTSFSATLEHLYNRKYIDEQTRDLLRLQTA